MHCIHKVKNTYALSCRAETLTLGLTFSILGYDGLNRMSDYIVLCLLRAAKQHKVHACPIKGLIATISLQA